MNTLDENIFTDYICPYLTGKIIDDVLLVNKQYNKVVKADMKHLYSLFWTIEEGLSGPEYGGGTYKYIYKDGETEGEQLSWWPNGQLRTKQFYKDRKQEGEQLQWYSDGPLFSKQFYKDGKRKQLI